MRKFAEHVIFAARPPTRTRTMAVRALSALVLVLVVALVLLATSKLQPIEVQDDARDQMLGSADREDNRSGSADFWRRSSRAAV